MQYNDILSKVKKLHFIGVGGSGMCPMAEILLQKGYRITGSDINESETLDRIRSDGIEVRMGHCAENIGDAEAVVYTAAVKKDNAELLAAEARGIPTFERSVMMGLVAKRYANSIAVSGTHGKTTTTAMVTKLFIDAGKDPSAIIGGRFPYIGGNSRIGKSDTMICEACEYVDSFLQLYPSVSVILNVDADHLDYFGCLDNIIRSFHQFALQTSGVLLVNGDNPNALRAVEGIQNAKILTFGLKEGNDYRAVSIQKTDKACERFVWMKGETALTEIALSVPGHHNIYNALAAAAVADFCGIPAEKIAESLSGFTGAHRRFEILGNFDGVTVADDFAHHPTELTATLSAAMEMGFRQVWAVFQPHTYSRTAMLLDDFAKALSIPDHTVLSEILAVREQNTYGIYAADLAKKIPGSVWFPEFPEIADYILGHAQPGDLVITLGGGDVYKCANLIVSRYRDKK